MNTVSKVGGQIQIISGKRYRPDLEDLGKMDVEEVANLRY